MALSTSPGCGTLSADPLSSVYGNSSDAIAIRRPTAPHPSRQHHSVHPTCLQHPPKSSLIILPLSVARPWSGCQTAQKDARVRSPQPNVPHGRRHDEVKRDVAPNPPLSPGSQDSQSFRSSAHICQALPAATAYRYCTMVYSYNVCTVQHFHLPSNAIR